MLEFNEEHMMADLSTIKSKTEKAKKAGKVMLSGIALSAVLLLSGCGFTTSTPNPTFTPTNNAEPITSASAIIMENGNAMIVDLKSYKKRSEDLGYGTADGMTNDRIWVLYTTTGDKMLVDFDSVKFIEGEDSHKKAETIAQSLISETGQVTCYNEVQTYGKTR